MDDLISQAIKNLKSRQPKLRGRKAALAPHVPQLRDLIAQGWTRADIIGELKSLGCSISPALLRDALQMPTVKNKPASRPKHLSQQTHTSPSSAVKAALPSPVIQQVTAITPYDQDQSTELAEPPLFNGLVNDAE
jgi:hypothetical protein